MSESEWKTVNEDGGRKVKVVLFEGWCVGFRPLDTASLEEKWHSARIEREERSQSYTGRLGYNKLEDVQLINNALKEYDRITL